MHTPPECRAFKKLPKAGLKQRGWRDAAAPAFNGDQRLRPAEQPAIFCDERRNCALCDLGGPRLPLSPGHFTQLETTSSRLGAHFHLVGSFTSVMTLSFSSSAFRLSRSALSSRLASCARSLRKPNLKILCVLLI